MRDAFRRLLSLGFLLPQRTVPRPARKATYQRAGVGLDARSAG
jgi:hypothetical protein